MSSLATSGVISAVPAGAIVLGDRFRVGEALGGPRFLAVDSASGASADVTRVRFGGTLRVERDEFVQRSRLLWAVTAPALVRVLDAGDWDDDAYVVEEQIAPPTRSLASSLARLDKHARASVATGVADAIAALHAGGFVHGDLSLESIVLDGYGQPKLHVAVVATRATPDAQHAESRRLRALLDQIAPGVAAASSEGASAADLSLAIPRVAAPESPPLVHVSSGRFGGRHIVLLLFLVTLVALMAVGMLYRG